jgi:hypothetical protein
MEPEPAMALLDVHCSQARPLYEQANEVAASIRESFEHALELAREVRGISERVNNREDGLEATRAKLAELAGNEALARKTLEVGRLRTWRQATVQEIDSWQETHDVDAAPDFGEPPAFDDTIFDAAPFLPIAEMEEVRASANEQARDSAVGTAAKLRGLVLRGEDEVKQVESDLAQELEQHGIEEGSEHLARMDQLRGRLESLDTENANLARLREEMERKLESLRGLISRSDDVRQELREARGTTCTSINDSMRTFRSRLEHDVHTHRVDELLELAKTGTWQRQTTLGSVRDSLDRARLLEVALLETSGQAKAIPQLSGMEAQDEIVRAALSRSRETTLGELASAWPEDGLMIIRREGGVPYQELTEGMRALAIKEFHFLLARFR